MIAEYLIENVTLTELTRFLNKQEQFKKQTGNEFTTNDVNQYIKLGHIPYYMGGNKIDVSDVKIKGMRIYNLRKNG